MGQKFSRRALLGAGLGSAILLVTPRIARAVEPSPAPAGFTFHGQAPSALTADPYQGGGLYALKSYQGKVFYGYGNYSSNSGSATGLGCDVAYFDPAVNAFGVAMPSYRTEQISVFREMSGKLFVPNIDPSSGAPAGNSFASNLGGQWRSFPGGNAIHVFDVCDSTILGEYFVAGSGGSADAATIWRTGDYGETWEEFFSEPSGSLDGYERFYWLARIGSKVYMRAHQGQSGQTPPFRWFDTGSRRWGKISNRKVGSLTGTVPSSGADVVINGGLVYFNNGGSVTMFDGRQGRTVFGTSGGRMSVGDDGRLYVLEQDSSGVKVISRDTATTVIAQTDLPFGGMTVLNGRVWLGGYHAELWSRAL